jgi:hypothetical protein
MNMLYVSEGQHFNGVIRRRDSMVVGFTIYAISACSCEFESRFMARFTRYNIM